MGGNPPVMVPRTSAKRHVWYLQPTVDLCGVQEVVDERSLPTQRDLVGRASLHPAQCHDTRDDVCMAKEGECDPLALAWLQDTIQRQDVKNLEVGKERARCGASNLMQKSSHSLEQRTGMAGGASSSNTGKNHPNLVMHPLQFPVEELYEKSSPILTN